MFKGTVSQIAPMRITHVSLILLAIIPVCLNARAQAPRPLGVNISGSGAFVNLMNETNRFVNATGYDTLGWPTSDFELVLADSRPVAEWSNDIDDPEVYRVDIGGTYHCSFQGIATVAISGSSAQIENQQYDSIANTTAYDIVVPHTQGANYGFLYESFTNTKRTASSASNTGVSSMKVMRPGYDLSTTKVFTDEYIGLLTSANFAGYRFYPVENIWDAEPVYPAVTKWSQRKLPRDCSQLSMASIDGKADGWCWEYIIQLANILGKDIWINIPISCDSDYVAHLATMLKTQLDPSINVYVENSNEVWSPTQATHGPYNQAEADYYGITFDQNYARRTVELARWFASVFGADAINNRIRVVLGAQQSYGGRSDAHLNYINSTFGPPKNFIYALSPSLYFGTTEPNGDTSAIVEGMLADITAQLDSATDPSYRSDVLARAKQWSLPGGCVSYEGGPGIPSGGGKTNLANQIEANRGVGIVSAIEKNYLDGWFYRGGGLAMYFTIESGYNRYGCWGITDDYTKPDRNYRMQAIRDVIASAAVHTPVIAMPPSFNIVASPNPAIQGTDILFNCVTDGDVAISVVNVLGTDVVSPLNRYCSKGPQDIYFDLSACPNGLYTIVVQSGSSISRARLVLVH